MKKIILIIFLFIGILSRANDEKSNLLKYKVSIYKNFFSGYYVKLKFTDDSLFFISKRKPKERNIKLAYSDIKSIKKRILLYLSV